MIDPAAATFEAFAAEYDLGRPSWPAAAVTGVGLPRDADVADLGAGTGKLTRVLLDRFERVVAVEPLAGMRTLIPSEATVLAGTAEAIPLEDGSMDGIFCGESFHWFDWPRALPEIARVLRPRGRLVMLWNRGNHGFPEEVEEILEQIPSSPGENRYQAFAWRAAFAGSAFDPLDHDILPNEEEITVAALIARIGTWSSFTTLPPDDRARLPAAIGSHLTEPSYRVRLHTHVWSTRRG